MSELDDGDYVYITYDNPKYTSGKRYLVEAATAGSFTFTDDKGYEVGFSYRGGGWKLAPLKAGDKVKWLAEGHCFDVGDICTVKRVDGRTHWFTSDKISNERRCADKLAYRFYTGEEEEKEKEVVQVLFKIWECEGTCDTTGDPCKVVIQVHPADNENAMPHHCPFGDCSNPVFNEV